MGLSLSDLLKRMLEMNGSDLHITTNSPPQIRVQATWCRFDLPQDDAGRDQAIGLQRHDRFPEASL